MSNYHKHVIFKNRTLVKDTSENHSAQPHHFLTPHMPTPSFLFYLFVSFVFYLCISKSYTHTDNVQVILSDVFYWLHVMLVEDLGLLHTLPFLQTHNIVTSELKVKLTFVYTLFWRCKLCSLIYQEVYDDFFLSWTFFFL